MLGHVGRPWEWRSPTISAGPGASDLGTVIRVDRTPRGSARRTECPSVGAGRGDSDRIGRGVHRRRRRCGINRCAPALAGRTIRARGDCSNPGRRNDDMNQKSAAAPPHSLPAGEARDHHELVRDVSEARGEVRTLKWASALAFFAIVGTMGFFYKALETFNEGQNDTRARPSAPSTSRRSCWVNICFVRTNIWNNWADGCAGSRTGSFSSTPRLDQVDWRLGRNGRPVGQDGRPGWTRWTGAWIGWNAGGARWTAGGNKRMPGSPTWRS